LKSEQLFPSNLKIFKFFFSEIKEKEKALTFPLPGLAKQDAHVGEVVIAPAFGR
jgi:hypothetical protein